MSQGMINGTRIVLNNMSRQQVMSVFETRSQIARVRKNGSVYHFFNRAAQIRNLVVSRLRSNLHLVYGIDRTEQILMKDTN